MRIILLTCFCLFLTSCTTDIENGTEPVKVGVITILSGDFAVVGEQVERSVHLALQELDDNYNYEFVFEDGKCDKALSVTAARKLIDVNNVEIILAAGCSDTTIAIAPIANEEHIVVLMPSTGGENIDTAGEYIFRNGNSDILAATGPAHDFVELFGFKEVALITDQTEAMEDIRKHFVAAYTQLGGTIVFDATTSPSEKDFRSHIARIKTTPADAVFVSSQTGITGAYFIKQYDELGKDIPIITNFNTATNTQTYTIAGNAMEGVYFYDPDYNEDSVEVEHFLQTYEETYESQPPLLFHSIATRDAVHMSVQALRAVGNDGEAIHDWLLDNIQGWKGYMGLVSFDERGNSQSGYTLKIIENSTFVKV